MTPTNLQPQFIPPLTPCFNGMAFWPGDERPEQKAASKRHEVAEEQNRHYPYLEPGLIGAAQLSEDGKRRLEWKFLAEPSPSEGGRPDDHLKFGNRVELFPPIRPAPLERLRTTIKQKAEQGANFLRTFFPDLDITSELIREQVVEDTTRSRDLERFDPSLGNLLELYESHGTTGNSFFIFPTGETGRDLTSCSMQSGGSQITFKPSATPSYSFSTPIQQLIVSPPKVNYSDGGCVCVRTCGSIQLLGMKEHIAGRLDVKELATLSYAHLRHEPIVDMKHLGSSLGILVAGSKGSVFQYDTTGQATASTLIYDSQILSYCKSELWRLALDMHPYQYFLLSHKGVRQLDSRTRSATNHFSISSSKDMLTSIEDTGQDHLVRLCSTKQIIWLDPRYLRKPLLVYAHGREYDQCLATSSLTSPDVHTLTFLTSRRSAMVTLYDVSASRENFLQLGSGPYIPSSHFGLYDKRIGQKIFFRDDCVGIVRLSERGGVTYDELLHSSSLEKEFDVEMPPSLKDLLKKNTKLQPDMGPLDRQDFSQVDMGSVYERLFRNYFDDKKAFEDRSAKSFHQVVEHFPLYLQTREIPIEYMLTTSDITLCAGDEPYIYSRTDFLAENTVNSTRGFTALKEGHFAAQMVKAPWQLSLMPTIQRLDRDFHSDIDKLIEHLEAFNLSESEGTPARDREINACRQLALDLILSSDVYSEAWFTKHGVEQTLENMTEALSLGDEPPPVEFGFLKPMERRSHYNPYKMNDVDPQKMTEPSLNLPMGVRLLLQSWDANDPDEFVYKDPYDESATVDSPKRVNTTPATDFTAYSKRPPLILASVALPLAVIPDISRKLSPPKVQSQDPFMNYPESFPQTEQPGGSESQELLMSTQVLPGPYGGRPAARKKPTKRRLGGF